MASSELSPHPEDEKKEEPTSAKKVDTSAWTKSSIDLDEPSSKSSADTATAQDRPLRPSRTSLDDPQLQQKDLPAEGPRLSPVVGRTRNVEDESAAVDETEEEEPQPTAGLNKAKIGLLGSKGVGKTYLFHGIIYRTLGKRAGAVSYYLNSSKLRVQRAGADVKVFEPFEAVRPYQRWVPFYSTVLGSESLYRLRLQFSSGLLGFGRSQIELEFLDGSGEAFADALSSATRPLWEKAFSNAAIVVFCLPMWAAFPAPGLSRDDSDQRERFLSEFYKVLTNYEEIRQEGLDVRTILALTMADDSERCALQELVKRWIRPYMEKEKTYLKKLQGRSGIPRYLANAYAVSKYLHEQFEDVDDKLVRDIPERLNFGKGQPWIIPVSAVEGKTLEKAKAIRNENPEATLPPDFPSPVPVHVELPLLAALCENQNALM